MRDIVEIQDGRDIRVETWFAGKAANVIQTQLGSLEYAQEFGCDLAFFLQSDLRFQNANFQVYLIQRLAEHQIDVSSVQNVLESFMNKITLGVSQSHSLQGT